MLRQVIHYSFAGRTYLKPFFKTYRHRLKQNRINFYRTSVTKNNSEINPLAKTKTTFFCQNCGAQFSKWQGQCTSCKEWNTIAEEIIQKAEKVSWKTQDSTETTRSRSAKPQRISEISTQAEARLDTKNNELNRVLGGGLVPGSLTLLGGEPGIGKS